MNTRRNRNLLGVGWLALLGVGLSGCGGTLRTAALEHAEASRTVAATLQRATTGLRCEQLPEDAKAGCRVSAGVIDDQAQALRDSAERLRRAAR